MNSHYSGWKGWNYDIYAMSLNKIENPILDSPKLQEKVKDEIIEAHVDIVREREAVYDFMNFSTTNAVSSASIINGLNTTAILTGVAARATTPTTVNATGRAASTVISSNRRSGPMPEMYVFEQTDTVKIRTFETTTDDDDDDTAKIRTFETSTDDDDDDTTMKRFGTTDSSDSSSSGEMVMIVTAPSSIINCFNPSKGDYSINPLRYETTNTTSSGNTFQYEGDRTPYVQVNRTYAGGNVVDSYGISSLQWKFMTDPDVPAFKYTVPPPTIDDFITDNYKGSKYEYVPNYITRDMDSEYYQIELEEVTVDTDQKDDYIFLRTKKDVSISIADLRQAGMEKMRITINRVNKAAYENMLTKVDELYETRKTIGKAEQVDNSMGDVGMSGYDAQAEASADGELNMDSLLNSYIAEVTELVSMDSTTAAEMKSKVNMKDFSTRLYMKEFFIPIYASFDKFAPNLDTDIKEWATHRVDPRFIKHQLKEITWDRTASTGSSIVNNKYWLRDPYYAMSYWLHWAMIGGFKPLDPQGFYNDPPEFYVQLALPQYRLESKQTYDGVLALSAASPELSITADRMRPASVYGGLPAFFRNLAREPFTQEQED